MSSLECKQVHESLLAIDCTWEASPRAMSYKAVLTGYYPGVVGLCQFKWPGHRQELISMTVSEKAGRFQNLILCPNITYTVRVRNAETLVKLVGKYIAFYGARNLQSA